MQGHSSQRSRIDIVQIGAHIGDTPHEIIRSLTPFHSCVMIEPVPYLFQTLVHRYTQRFPVHNIRFLNCAVSDKEGSLKLHVPSSDNDWSKLPFWASQLASVDSKHATTHLPELKMETLNVPCISIGKLLEVVAPGDCEIEWLLIDTEGHDYTILMELDLERWRPRNIVFEAKHMDGTFQKGERYARLLKHFIDAGYKLVSEGVEDTHIQYSSRQ